VLKCTCVLGATEGRLSKGAVAALAPPLVNRLISQVCAYTLTSVEYAGRLRCIDEVSVRYMYTDE